MQRWVGTYCTNPLWSDSKLEGKNGKHTGILLHFATCFARERMKCAVVRMVPAYALRAEAKAMLAGTESGVFRSTDPVAHDHGGRELPLDGPSMLRDSREQHHVFFAPRGPARLCFGSPRSRTSIKAYHVK